MKPEAEGIQMPVLPAIPWTPSLRLEPEDLRGLVVLVHFWDSTCLPCLRALPWLAAWHERYRQVGLLVLGVHTPEFLFGDDAERVQALVGREGIRYPVGLDLERRVWEVFHNRYWPARYLFDRRGRLRDYHYGEGDEAGCEAVLRECLLEGEPEIALPPPLGAPGGTGLEPSPAVSPEIYLGLERAQFGNEESAIAGETHRWRLPGRRDPGRPYLDGPWRAGLRHLESVSSEPASLHAMVSAAGAHALLAPAGESPVPLEVLADREPVAAAARGADLEVTAAGRTLVVVAEPRLYELLRADGVRDWDLVLRVEAPGLRAYTLALDGPRRPPPHG